MNARLQGHRSPFFAWVILGVAVSGCGPSATILETAVLPEPKPAVSTEGLPLAYPRSQINDAGLRAVAEGYKSWALKLRSGGVSTGPLFSRIEVLPPTQTALPYGVGTYDREPRLPAILTVGPGWASQTPEEKEAVAARAFTEVNRSLRALNLDPPLRPTLTIQTPQGLVLGWINDLEEGRRNLHGDGD